MKKKMKKIQKMLGIILIMSICLMPMASFASSEDPDFALYMEKTCTSQPEEILAGNTIGYQLKFYGTCTEYPDWEDAIYAPVVTDTLPEGLEYIEGSAKISGDKYDCYDMHIEQKENQVIFRIFEPDEEEEGVEYPCIYTDEHMVIEYSCKIRDDVKSGLELTNIAVIEASDDIDPASDSETVTVISNEEPAADEPYEPAQSEAAKEKEKAELDDAPKTGDESPIMWVVIAMATTLTSFTMVFRCMEREV